MEPRRRFRFLREIAQGGFGKVYLAEMITGENFSSVVAIKLLHGQWLGNDEIVMRSRDEARLLGKIRHRNIVRVEDLTSINAQCAIIMEYLEGVDLKTACNWLKEQGLLFPRHAAFESLGAVATALDAAYNQSPLQGGEPLQVIHRDIKPSNCMITVEGEVKVLDFGTARATFEEREAKTQALAFGSQAYMAPERLLAEPDSPSGDIFSLGVTLYELLTLKSFGKIYLRPDKYESVLTTRLEEKDESGNPVIDLSSMPESAQKEAMDLLRAMLAYEPTARPTAAEVLDRVEQLAEHCRDAGLKRFARERIRDILTASKTQPDPNDPLTGTVVFEDTGSFQNQPSDISSPRPLDPQTQEAREKSVAINKDISEPRVGSDQKNSDPKNSDKKSGEIKDSLGDTPAPPKNLSTVTPTPRPTPPAPESGGFGKILMGLAVLGVLGVLVLGGGYLVVNNLGVASTDGPNKPQDTPSSRRPSGQPTPDFSPNSAGKGSAILQISEPVQGVIVRNPQANQTFEWDGTLFYHLRNLEPGTWRAKVEPQSGAAFQTTFKVQEGKICLYTLQMKTQEWEEKQCQ